MRVVRPPIIRRRSRRASRGQSLVEFSLVLTPLFLILLGIIQFGFIFNAQVTITNAAREGARAATIYVYRPNLSKAGNDLARNLDALAAAKAAFGTLSQSSPQFVAPSPGPWINSGTDPAVTYTNTDFVISYAKPEPVTDSDPRTGEQVRVQITYHQDLVVPLISSLLPKDANGRLAQTATVTMVIN